MKRSTAGATLGFALLTVTAACVGTSDVDVDVEEGLSPQWKPKKDSGTDTGSGADSGSGTDSGTDARTDSGTDSGTDAGVDSGPPPFEDACLLPGSSQPAMFPYNYVSADAQDEGASAAIPLPFAFTFFGQAQTHYWVTSNGELGFGTDARGMNFGQITTCPLPRPEVTKPTILAYTGDLVGGTICVATTGTAPNRRLVVTWKDKAFYDNTGASVAFGAVLNEGTNKIDLRVHRMTMFSFDPTFYNGNTVVLGLQRGTSAQTFSCFGNAPPGTEFHYTP